MRWSMAWVCAVLIASTGVDSRGDDPNRRGDFPLQSRFEPIIVSGFVGNQTCRFVVSTGATSLLFSPAQRHLLGEPGGRVRRVGLGQVRIVEQYRLEPVAIAGVVKTGLMATEDESLDLLNRVACRKADAELGRAFFLDSVLQLDFDEGVARLQERYEPESDDRAYRLLDDDTVGIGLDLGVPTGLRISTGLVESPMVLPRSHLDKLTAKAGQVQQIQLGDSELGTLPQSLFVMRQVRLGGVALKDLWGYPGTIATVTLPVIGRYRATFDFPNKRLYLKPREGMPERDPPDASGLFLRMKDGVVFVRDVYLQGAAYQAGLRANDRIVSVNGTPIAQFTFAEIYALLREAGREVTFVVDRARDPDAEQPTLDRKMFRFPLKHLFEWPPVWPAEPVVRKPIPVD